MRAPKNKHRQSTFPSIEGLQTFMGYITPFILNESLSQL